MARTRTGVYTLTKILLSLCKYIVTFTPILMIISNNSPALALALEAASTACEALRLELEPYRNEG